MGGDRVILVGTDDGLYRAAQRNGGYDTTLLGLKGKGMIAHPTVIDRSDPKTIYAGTLKAGVWRSTDAGKTWQECNDGIMYKEVWSIAQHPKTGELYAGTGPTSVFKSSDGGDTWIDLAGVRKIPESKEWDFPAPPHVSHVRGLALHPKDPRFIVGAVEVGWCVRSADGGQTWQNVQSVWKDSHSACWMPDDTEVVMWTSGKGVFRSEDKGASFAESMEGIDRTYMAQIGVNPKRPNVLITAGAEGPPPLLRRPQGADSHVFRSEDQGKSWERLTGGLPDNIKGAPRGVAADPDDENTFAFGLTDGAVWLTEDGGDSWREIVKMETWVRSLRITHA